MIGVVEAARGCGRHGLVRGGLAVIPMRSVCQRGPPRSAPLHRGPSGALGGRSAAQFRCGFD